MCLAEPGQIGFYRSSDLKTWRSSGRLQKADLGTLECPNLFPMNLHGADGKITGEKWILMCGANGTAGGFTTGDEAECGAEVGYIEGDDEAVAGLCDGVCGVLTIGWRVRR